MNRDTANTICCEQNEKQHKEHAERKQRGFFSLNKTYILITIIIIMIIITVVC